MPGKVYTDIESFADSIFPEDEFCREVLQFTIVNGIVTADEDFETFCVDGDHRGTQLTSSHVRLGIQSLKAQLLMGWEEIPSWTWFFGQQDRSDLLQTIRDFWLDLLKGR